MVDYLYLHEIISILKGLKKTYGGSTQVPENLSKFLDEDADQEHKCRIEFLVDMTFLPTVLEGSERAREEIIEQTESVGENQSRWGKFVAWTVSDAKWYIRPIQWACRLLVSLRRLLRIRRSLQYSLDTLAEEEFVIRLKNSRFGKALASVPSAEKLDSHINNLKEVFKSIGKAYSEKFSRKCRVLTVIVGFFLAFVANIDSLALINTFMTDPELRNQIIERSEDILSQAPSDPKDPSTDRTDMRIRKLGDKIGDQIKHWEEILKALPPGISENENIKKILTEAEKSREDVQATFNDANDTFNDIRRTVIGVTQNFPVGWSFYPNCAESDDPRCLRYKKRSQGKTTKDQKDSPSSARPDSHPPKSENTKEKGMFDWFARWLNEIGTNYLYIDVYRSDAAQYLRWLTGVLLTGLLLGLGTPFWIQVVTSFLRARNLIRGSGTEDEKSEEDKNETETKKSKPPAAGSSVETDIPKVDTTGKRRLLT